MKSVLESDIQRTVCDYLFNYKRYFGWRNNNVGVYDPTTRGFRRPQKYAPKGLPDIQVITDGGFTIFLEIKRKGGKQSPDQKDFEQKCKDKGAEYYVIKDVGELKEIGL